MVDAAVDDYLPGPGTLLQTVTHHREKKDGNNLGIAATAAMIEEATGRKAFVIGKPSLIKTNIPVET